MYKQVVVVDHHLFVHIYIYTHTLTEADDMAFSQNNGWAIAEGISGESSSEPTMPQDTRAYIRGKLFKWIAHVHSSFF